MGDRKMTRIKFGDTSPETLRAVVVMKKAAHIKMFGRESRYSEQTAYLRDVLGEHGALFNRDWGEGW
jgi:hypothetical protein